MDFKDFYITNTDGKRVKASSFSIDQQKELYLALKDGLNVSLIANKSVEAACMRVLRKALKEGINLNDYTKNIKNKECITPDYLKALKLFIKEKVDITLLEQFFLKKPTDATYYDFLFIKRIVENSAKSFTPSLNFVVQAKTNNALSKVAEMQEEGFDFTLFSKYKSNGTVFKLFNYWKKDKSFDIKNFSAVDANRLNTLLNLINNDLYDDIFLDMKIPTFNVEYLAFLKKNGFDIRPVMYMQLKPTQLKQVIDGVKKGINYKIYANSSYSEGKMCVIKEALIEKNDLSKINLDTIRTNTLSYLLQKQKEGYDITGALSIKTFVDNSILDLYFRGIDEGIDLIDFINIEFCKNASKSRRLYYTKKETISLRYDELDLIFNALKNGDNFNPDEICLIVSSLTDSISLEDVFVFTELKGITIKDIYTELLTKRRTLFAILKEKVLIVDEEEILGDFLKEKTSEQKKFIKEVFKKGYPVLYFKEDLSIEQMNVIKEGLDKKLDVSVYAHKKYTFPQMEEIMFALEDNLDCTSLLDEKLSDIEMSKIRNELLSKKTKK